MPHGTSTPLIVLLNSVEDLCKGTGQFFCFSYLVEAVVKEGPEEGLGKALALVGEAGDGGVEFADLLGDR